MNKIIFCHIFWFSCFVDLKFVYTPQIVVHLEMSETLYTMWNVGKVNEIRYGISKNVSYVEVS